MLLYWHSLVFVLLFKYPFFFFFLFQFNLYCFFSKLFTMLRVVAAINNRIWQSSFLLWFSNYIHVKYNLYTLKILTFNVETITTILLFICGYKFFLSTPPYYSHNLLVWLYGYAIQLFSWRKFCVWVIIERYKYLIVYVSYTYIYIYIIIINFYGHKLILEWVIAHQLIYNYIW